MEGVIQDDASPSTLSSASNQPKLHTVKYLEKNCIDDLVAKYSLTARWHRKYPNLVQLKYDQLESNMSSPIVQECRGLLLEVIDPDQPTNSGDTQKNENSSETKENGSTPKTNPLSSKKNLQYRVLSFPYTKFFNYNESNAAKIDWSTSQVYEKMDGSLSILYHYNGEWNVATSGTPDAGGRLNKANGKPWEDYTFSRLFWEIWKESSYKLPSNEDIDKCFMFELFSFRSQVLVTPKEEAIFLHGVRELNQLQELNPDIYIDKYNWRRAPLVAKNTTLAELVEKAKSLDPSQHEGYVVVDGSFNRIKIKSPNYVMMSLLTWRDKDKMNKKRMLEVVRTNEGSEFISYFPQWKHLHDHLKMRYDELCLRIENAFEEANKETDPKVFARATAKYTEYAPCLWSLRKGETASVKEYMATVDIKRLESMLPKESINTLPMNENSKEEK